MIPDDPGEQWRESALCAQTDPEAFFPEKGGSSEEAKQVCAQCDVRAECLAYALSADERFGVWGGLSPNERNKRPRDTAGRPATRAQAVKKLRDERIRSLAEDDVNVPAIAAEAGVTERTVHRVLRKHRQATDAVPA